jgi:hypothetical protein
VTAQPSYGAAAPQPRTGRHLHPGLLWGGGLTTAVVAALVAAVGNLICETVFGIELLPTSDRGILGWSTQVSYPTGAALLALAATAVLHLLLVAVPQPLRFFGWLMGLVTVAVGIAPFGYGTDLSSQVATAVVNVVTAMAIWSLLSGTARRAVSVPGPRRGM